MMYETTTQEKSPRLITAESVGNFLREVGLCHPYGGDVSRSVDRKNRVYYSVPFSLPGDLDGVISIYKPKYFVLKFKTRFTYMPAEDTILIKNQDNLFAFLKAAFVDRDEQELLRVLDKIHQEG